MTDTRQATSTQTEAHPPSASMQMAIDVERGLREEQVGIFFVMPRVVRRVLQSELDVANPWLPPPHRKCCVMSRDRLLWLVALDELGVEPHARLPETVILIAQPEEDQLATMTREELLRHYWRLMFHARIDYALMSRTSPQRMPIRELRRRIDELGQTAFDEIRSVLRSEQMLMRPEDDRNIYAEFVAVYHELKAFAPRLIPVYFPSLPPDDEVLRVIGADCDAEELLASTRPSHIDAETPLEDEVAERALNVPSPADVTTLKPLKPRQLRGVLRKAERLSAKANNVRAALTLHAALQHASADGAEQLRERYQAEIQKLVSRLQAALKLSHETAEPWLVMCEKLIPRAQLGFWNANARLLYDLQNVCFDHEHEIYKIDLLRWLVTFGKTPLKRPLPNQRTVMMSKHLRSASNRVASVKIDPQGRRELTHLLHKAADAAESILRARLQPLIARVLADAGFVPTSIVERVALHKLIHELADSVVERGYITIGILRDAVSRNQMKMPDLANSTEFVHGDPLLRADRQMAETLDGVYPRGPFYLRWLQKASSIAFGVPWGRIFTRFVALPFGLSFFTLKGLDVALEHLPFGPAHAAAVSHAVPPAEAVSPEAVPVTATLSNVEGSIPAATAGDSGVHKHVDIVYSHTAMFLLGCVIFALIHFPAFRRGVVWVLQKLWSFCRVVMIRIPRAILRWKIVDVLLKSFPMMLFRQFVFAPLIATAVFWIVLPVMGFYPEPTRWGGLGIFLVSFVLLNSRIGRDTEELAREFFERTWYRFRVHLVMGLFTLVVDVFHALMDGLERVLYAVDEWLRYRSGESQFTLAVKSVVGLIWSFIHGVIRFCVTLLIEPQVNPIKHFPVVTVSHKIVFAAFFKPISDLLQKYFENQATASSASVIILASIPGVFGFLVWELKENWKLYKANRSPNLQPVPIGEHGETLLRLLCPGFHSGTIPRLYAKRRRAGRREKGIGPLNKQAKFLERLHHEATAVRHFIERELLELLHESRTFRQFTFAVDEVRFSTNRVQVKIIHTTRPHRPMELEFAEQSGWLIAVVREPGWQDDLEQDESDVFRAALTGLFKLASVELVREQIERQLRVDHPRDAWNPTRPSALAAHPYDVGAKGLIVWPHATYDVELYYPLEEQPVSHPRPRSVARTTTLSPLPLERLVFSRSDVTWQAWQSFWENEQNLPAYSAARFPYQW